VVGAHVAGDLEEPGPRRRLAAELGQGRQGPEVHLLGEVVGIGPVAQPSADAPHLGLRPPHEGGRRHPIPRSRSPRELGQIVHAASLVSGNQSPQSSDPPPMRCDAIREALSARLDGELSELGDDAVDAHVATCRGCAAWSEELTLLHRIVRVREAEPVPDLTAAILGTPEERPATTERRTLLWIPSKPPRRLHHLGVRPGGVPRLERRSLSR